MSDTLNLSPRLYALFVASYVPLRQSFCVFVSKPSLHYKKKAVHIRARIPCAIIENKPGTSKARNQTRKVASQTNTLYYQPSAKYPPGKFPLSLEIDFIFNHPISEGIIALLVSLNCLAFALQTLDVGPLMYEAFRSYESNLSIVFLIEYFCRWYGKGLSPRYLLSRAMILDFIAVAPLGFAVADQSEALFVRILRLSRIFRLTSLVMDSESGKEMMENMTVVQLRLANIGLSLFSLLYVSAGLFYQVEKDVNPAVQNFFDAFYFSTITLFTVGFGDITPLTSLGKSITLLTVILGAVLIPFQISEVERVRKISETKKAENIPVVTVRNRYSDALFPPYDVDLNCPSCYLKGHQVDARYCRNCGAKLSTSSEDKQQS